MSMTGPIDNKLRQPRRADHGPIYLQLTNDTWICLNIDKIAWPRPCKSQKRPNIPARPESITSRVEWDEKKG